MQARRKQISGSAKCWSAVLGITPVSLSGEIALCGGTDGISLGASGSAGGATGGFLFNCLIFNFLL